MGCAVFDNHPRPAWNLGRKIGSKRALEQKEVWAIRFWLEQEGRMRDRALFDLAIDSKLRGCDLVRVRIADRVSGTAIRDRALVVRGKTGRPVQFATFEPARTTLLAWLERRGGSRDDSTFASRCNHPAHLGTRQHSRLVDEWVSAIGLRAQDYGTHALRRTKASILSEQTGNLRAVQWSETESPLHPHRPGWKRPLAHISGRLLRSGATCPP